MLRILHVKNHRKFNNVAVTKPYNNKKSMIRWKKLAMQATEKAHNFMRQQTQNRISPNKIIS